MCCADRVVLIVLGAMWSLVGGIDSAEFPASDAEYWFRLNYGVAAVRVKDLCLAEGYASHVLHIEVPLEVYADIRTFNYSDDAGCDHLCARMKAIPSAIARLRTEMRKSVTHMLSLVYVLLPDIDDRRLPRRRHNRGLVDAVGKIASFLFGVAVQSDVDAFKADINDIEGIVSEAAADAARARDGVSQYTKIASNRLDVMHQILSEERTAIQSLADAVKGISDSNYYEYNAIALMSDEIARFVRMHDDVQMLMQGVVDLVGKG